MCQPRLSKKMLQNEKKQQQQREPVGTAKMTKKSHVKNLEKSTHRDALLRRATGKMIKVR